MLDDAAPAAEPAERRLAFVLHAHLPWVLGHGTLAARRGLAGRGGRPLLPAAGQRAAAGSRRAAAATCSPSRSRRCSARSSPTRARRRSSTATSSTARDAARELAAAHPLAAWWHVDLERLLVELGRDRRRPAGRAARARRARTPSSSRPAPPRTATCRCSTAASTSACSSPPRAANHRALVRQRPARLLDARVRLPPRRPLAASGHRRRGGRPPGQRAVPRRAGVRWTVVDAHLLLRRRSAGRSPSCGAPATRPEQTRRRSGRRAPPAAPDRRRARWPRCLREPHTAHQVWSRQGGYPGDPRYLDFHKRHGRDRPAALAGDRRRRRPRRQAPLPPRRGDGRRARAGRALPRAARRHRRPRRRRRRLPLRRRAVRPLVVRGRRLARGGARQLPRRRPGDARRRRAASCAAHAAGRALRRRGLVGRGAATTACG